MDGLSDFRETVNHEDHPVLTAFGPMQWHDKRWAVLVEFYERAARDPLRQFVPRIAALVATRGSPVQERKVIDQLRTQ